MIKSIKMTYLGTLAFAALLFGITQIDAKHYSREKEEECHGVSDSCKRVIDTAMYCKEICDALAENRAPNYPEDKKVCIARCRENIAACEACIEQCRHHIKGMESKEERRNMRRCIKKCYRCINACKNTIAECHVDKSKKNCIKACRKSCKALSECIEACREVINEDNDCPRPMPCPMPYEVEIEEYGC